MLLYKEYHSFFKGIYVYMMSTEGGVENYWVPYIA